MSGQSRTIGRFDDATLIGRGGFGAVYEADDAEHGRKVAIKVLPGTMGDTERRRFDRERQTMGRLGSHPNIIPVHESGYTDDGEGYIVMELAPGGSLRARLDEEGPLGWEEAIGIAIAMAGAAQAAHDQGVLHRDIKPDNILIDGYGNPRLTDFGIAAVASNATATTSTTATLAHAAPELLEGQTSTVAVDIYAIGSTFYNLVMGHPPFMTDETVGVTAMIGRALTQPPPDLRPLGVPDAVAAVIERSMAKEAGDRQRSASELADALRAASPTRGPPWWRRRRPIRRGPRPPPSPIARWPIPRPTSTPRARRRPPAGHRRRRRGRRTPAAPWSARPWWARRTGCSRRG
ncbi:MAG: serine/threonine-protein kinase, partial [Actinomycetota bacterium]